MHGARRVATPEKSVGRCSPECSMSSKRTLGLAIPSLACIASNAPLRVTKHRYYTDGTPRIPILGLGAWAVMGVPALPLKYKGRA